jgi:hypothetical protein
MKKRLGKMEYTTEVRLVTYVIKVWLHDNGVKTICSKLAESSPKRVQEVILAKG